MTTREALWTFARAEDTGDDDSLWFRASTPGVKRDGLDLRASGWLTERFEANPVVLWTHNDLRPPIGRVVDVDATDDALRTRVTFDRDDPFAADVERKYRAGFMNAVSVRWDWTDEAGAPIDYWKLSADQLRDDAYYDLMELSAVPLPADPDALVERARTGLRHTAVELLETLGPWDAAELIPAFLDETVTPGMVDHLREAISEAGGWVLNPDGSWQLAGPVRLTDTSLREALGLDAIEAFTAEPAENDAAAALRKIADAFTGADDPAPEAGDETGLRALLATLTTPRDTERTP